MYRTALTATTAALDFFVLLADVNAWTGGRHLPDDAHLLLTTTAAVLTIVAATSHLIRHEIGRAVEEVYRLGMVSGAQRTIRNTRPRGHLSQVDD